MTKTIVAACLVAAVSVVSLGCSNDATAPDQAVLTAQMDNNSTEGEGEPFCDIAGACNTAGNQCYWNGPDCDVLAHITCEEGDLAAECAAAKSYCEGLNPGTGIGCTAGDWHFGGGS